MNKFIKLSFIISLTLSIFTSSVLAEEPEFKLDAALTSNYVWRGMTQTQDKPAYQGGIGTTFEGFHANLWASSVTWKEDNKTDTIELDYNAGYTFKFARMELDLSYYAFTYPEAKHLDFKETKISLSTTFDNVTLGYSYSAAIDQNDTWNSDAGSAEALISIGAVDIVFGDYKEVGTYYTISYSKPFRKINATISYSSGLQAPDDEESDTTTTKIDRSEDPKVFVTINYIFD